MRTCLGKYSYSGFSCCVSGVCTYLDKNCIVGFCCVSDVFWLIHQNKHLSGTELYCGFTCCVSGVFSLSELNLHLSGQELYSWFLLCE